MANYDFVAYCTMLADKERLDAYTRALSNAISDGCTVLDLGSGTGFFSFLAVQCGAGKVYAVETNPLIDLSKSLASANSVANKIEFIKKPSTEIELKEKVDVLVSDLHGTLPFFGKSLDTIIDARERLLRPGGTMIPARENVLFAVADCTDFYTSNIEKYVANFGGFDMSSANHLVTDRLLNAYKRDLDLLSAAQVFVEMDYRELKETEFSKDLEFSITQRGNASGLRAWFTADLDDQNSLSNSPENAETVYGAPFFPFSRSFEVSIGDRITCRISATKYNDGYTWAWNTDVFDSGGNLRFEFRQSTLRGTYCPPAEILRQSEYYIPKFTTERDVDLFVLERFDGFTPLGDIADGLVNDFPDRFEKQSEAFKRVVQLVQHYED